MTISKKEIFIFFAAIAVIAGSFYYLKSSNGGNILPKENNIAPVAQRSEAIEIATEFMKEQEFRDEYDLDSAKLDNFTDFWNVWFDKKDQNQRPNKGLVQIDKKTREAQWKLVQ